MVFVNSTYVTYVRWHRRYEDYWNFEILNKYIKYHSKFLLKNMNIF